MSDLVNALSQAGHSSSVLSGIANPSQPNILGLYGGAMQAANAVWQNRANQADMAVGQAYQNAIDPQTGEFNPEQFRRNLVAAGPGAALRAGTGLLNTQQIASNQQEMDVKKLNWYNSAAGSLMALGDKITPDHVNNLINEGLRFGIISQADANRERQAVPQDTAGLMQYARQHQLQGADAANRYSQANGSWTAVNAGGATYLIPTPPMGTGQGSIMVPHTMSPDVVGQQMIEWPATEADVKAGRATAVGQPVRMGGADIQRNLGQGGLLPPGARVITVPAGTSTGAGGAVVTQDGKPVSSNNQPRLLNVPKPSGGSSDSGPPAPPGGSGAPYSGGGIGSALAPKGGTIGPRSDAGGAATVAGDMGAMQAGIAQAQTSRMEGPRTAATFAVGPGVQEPAQWKASADRLAADDNMAANFAQTQFPSVQALREYGRGTVTGPNADFFNRIAGYIRTPLQKLGFEMGDLNDNNQRYDALNKWLSQIVSSTPFAAGSDARLSQVLNGSANTHINQAAGEDMLKAGIILQRMNVAANQQWHNMSQDEQAQYGGLYLNFLRGYANRVDPRAFGVDMYNDKQLTDLRAALKAGGNDAAKRFNDSRAIATGLSAQPALP